ncbi:aminocarboxymuconate-semialdehyde decarboxylase [Actinomycetospora succinea]|uniref:Aminocarboxymuconate-semialdehyde decarboxylase n=1 Tax=Actinomycetospora succinea TaxID=663603 RepID=A0A4R6VNW9_9PSEU|nr:amidohydrolase family protein [Actinomycetospora succinea]TDQ65713.1 aminocarboxymuconate-semialdehyde decarboxylase [Actinomycetospora succinea]
MSPTTDVHAHLLVPAAEALVADEPALGDARAAEARAAGAASARVNREQIAALGPALTDRAVRLAGMDAAGIEVQLVSPMPIHHTWAERDLAARYAATVNDGVLAHCAGAPDRLVGLGTTPLQHPDLAVSVLRAAIADGLRGVEVGTHVTGPDGARRELDDPALAGFWAAAAELEAIVFVHPWGCTLGERLDVGYLSNSVGNPVETTVALSRLVASNALPAGVRVLAAHGGGFFPQGTARQDHAWHARPGDRAAAASPSEALRRLWFDALVYTPEALRHLVAVAGADRVALGTDFPFDMGVTDPLDRLSAAGLDPADAELVRAGSAAALLAPARERAAPR